MELGKYRRLGTSVLLMTWAMFGEAAPLAADAPAVAERKSDMQPSEVIKRFGSSAFRQVAAQIAYSPDGRWLIAASYQNVKLFDAKTGELGPRCMVKYGPIELTYSPDRQSLAIHDARGLTVWEPKVGALPQRTFDQPDYRKGFIRESVASPDGQWRAAAHPQEIWVTTWDKFEPIHRIPFKEHFPSLAMGNEGKWVAASNGRSKVVKIWTAPQFDSPLEWTAARTPIRTVATSPDGETLYAGGIDGSIQAWNVKEGREVFKMPSAQRSAINSLVFSPEGKHLAAASQDVVLIEIATRRLAFRVPLEDSVPAPRIAFSPDGKTLAIAPNTRPIELWDVEAGKVIHKSTDPAIENVFATKDRRLFGSYTDGSVSLWSQRTGQRVESFPIYPWPKEQGHHAGDALLHGTEQLILKTPKGELGYRDLSLGQQDFEPLGSMPYYDFHATYRNGRAMQLHYLGPGFFRLRTFPVTIGDRTPRLLWELKASASPYLQWEFSQDGQVLAASFADRSVFVWSTQTGNLIHRLKLDQTPKRMLLNSSGGLLAITFDESIAVWDLKAGQEIQKYPAPKSEKHMVAFGNKQKFLAVSTPDEPIRLWSLEIGNEILALPAPDSRAMAMVFSPDDKTLAVGFQDKTIGLYDLDKKEEIQLLEGHSGQVTCLEFDPQGSRLISGSKAPEASVWEVKTGQRLSAKKQLMREIREVHWSADGSHVFVVDESNRFTRFTALKDDAVSYHVAGSRSLYPKDFAYSKSSEFLAVAFDLGIRIMDGNGQEQPFLRENNVKRVEWSDDGRVLMAASDDLFGFDVDLQKELYRVPADKLGSQVSAMAKSPDGRTVATGHSGTKVSFWDPKTGQLIREFSLPDKSTIESLQFSRDGRLIFGFSRTSYLVIEVESGLVWFQKPNGPDPDTSFAVMGRDMLLSAEPLGTARLWSFAQGPKTGPSQPTEQLWESLSTTDGPTVARSMFALADGGDETVAFLADHLPGVPVPAEKVIALITDLADEAPAKRRRASEELRSLGKQARPHLETALKSENLSPRVRLRIRLLLSARDSAVSPELLAGRAIQLLEWIATPKAKALLEKWASESTGQLAREAQAALARLTPSKP